jgi:hypothetical protein
MTFAGTVVGISFGNRVILQMCEDSMIYFGEEEARAKSVIMKIK